MARLRPDWTNTSPIFISCFLLIFFNILKIYLSDIKQKIQRAWINVWHLPKNATTVVVKYLAFRFRPFALWNDFAWVGFAKWKGHRGFNSILLHHVCWMWYTVFIRSQFKPYTFIDYFDRKSSWSKMVFPIWIFDPKIGPNVHVENSDRRRFPYINKCDEQIVKPLHSEVSSRKTQMF